MITEDYVSFETAKLLKEKGFKGVINAYHHIWDPSNRVCSIQEFRHSEAPHLYFPVPTLQMAMKYLRKMHGLDIDISIEYKNSKKVYYYSILKKTTIRDIDCLHSETNFDSYEEACEAAIKYYLENLV